MRTDLVPAGEALALITAGAAPLGAELVDLRNAAGRVLAKDLDANLTQPPFRASAMDGYAVRGGDVVKAGARLVIVGEAAAGHPFSGRAGPGQAVRIFTGAAVPEGADTVVMQENAIAVLDQVEITKAVTAGHSVRPEGLDFRQGDTLLRRGEVLDPQRLSLAAAMNHAQLPLWRKPIVAVAATGDELQPPGSALETGQIIASNTFGLMAVIEAAGGHIIDLGILRDHPGALDVAFEHARHLGADVIVTTGSASVGDHDLVMPAFERLGAVIAFSKIAMRPGKPLIFGKSASGGKMLYCLGLAGNPVSSLVAAHVFVRPLIAALAGLPSLAHRPMPAVLGCKLSANGDREDHMRAGARRLADGTLEVSPFKLQDSSMLATLARADAIVVRPAHANAAAKGDACRAILLKAV